MVVVAVAVEMMVALVRRILVVKMLLLLRLMTIATGNGQEVMEVCCDNCYWVYDLLMEHCGS